MNLVNETPFTYAPFMGKVVYPKDTLTLIVKGTFQLIPDQPAEPVDPGDHLPPTGDQFYDDDPHCSVRYESDFVHFKPRADVCVVGHCHVPGGIERPACSVSFKAGGISKSLMVFGDRQWKRTLVGTRSMSDPEPFTAMELRYENSFGGSDYSHNPVGKGIRSKTGAEDDAGHQLPNLKVLEGKQLETMHEGAPAGFGPLGRTWSQRMALVGTYGKKWQNERWPWLPEDFDWGYFNAAPSDQQVKGYLMGDEALYFENMHPEHRTFNTSLPGVRLRSFIFERKDGRHIFREVKTQLDTVWVDMDAQTLVLVWRGLATVVSKTCEQVEDVFIVQEAVQDEPHTVDHYEKLFKQRKAELASEAAPAEEWSAPESAEDPAKKMDTTGIENDGGLAEQIQKAMKQAREALGQLGLDPKLAAALKSEKDPERFLEMFGQSLDLDPAAVEKAKILSRRSQKQMLEQYRPQVEKLLAKFGYDASVLDNLDSLYEDPAPAEESPAPSCEELAEAARSGEGAGEQDMSGADFSGLSLEGANFREAQLDGANFLHARLAGADFSMASLEGAIFEGADLPGADFKDADLNRARLSGANLIQANLSDAILTEANLIEADLSEAILFRAQLTAANLAHARIQRADLEQIDLSGANLNQSDLSGARLGLAVLDNADLTQANLSRATGQYVSLVGSNLTEANFSNAELEDGDFSGCRCDFANYEAALLNRATFEGAVGRQVNLKSAALNQVRAGEGVSLPQSNFRRATGAKANWAGADLQGSDFILVDMPGCDFSATNLTGCDCRTAEMKQSVLNNACLKNAQFNRANLFQVRMQEADLTGADFKGCNLHGSEFLDATISNKTNFSEANLKGTKLAGLKP